MIHGCMKSIPAATPITLTKEEHAELEGLARSTKTEHGGDNGRGLCCFRRRAWRRAQSAERSAARRARRRNGGYATPSVGGPASTKPAIEAMSPKIRTRPTSLLAVLDRPIPAGYARWNGPLIAKALGDVDVQYVWRFLRTHKIDLAGRRPKMLWFWPSTRSRRSKRWSARRAI